MSYTEVKIIEHLERMTTDDKDIRKLIQLARADEPRTNTGNGMIHLPQPRTT